MADEGRYFEEHGVGDVRVERASRQSPAAPPPPRLLPIITYSIPPPTTASTLCFVRELADVLKKVPAGTANPAWISDATRLLTEVENALVRDDYDGDISCMADDVEGLFPIWQWVLARDQGVTTPEIRTQEGSPPTVRKPTDPHKDLPTESWADLMRMVDRMLVLANRFDANGKQY